ncbi:hypothetical protein CCACVL1_28871 [Corchorus capsularis]|uniref:Uncharacterized protein n=1 Tax=Corchorus capsularis TaxID=210143 RepID=A0A1R3G4Y5_COCAP|nr:hypothetical protein CCACVL1_28871 [Corchorus capsularis]
MGKCQGIGEGWRWGKTSFQPTATL